MSIFRKKLKKIDKVVVNIIDPLGGINSEELLFGETEKIHIAKKLGQ
jgi:hypothetical protein